MGKKETSLEKVKNHQKGSSSKQKMDARRGGGTRKKSVTRRQCWVIFVSLQHKGTKKKKPAGREVRGAQENPSGGGGGGLSTKKKKNGLGTVKGKVVKKKRGSRTKEKCSPGELASFLHRKQKRVERFTTSSETGTKCFHQIESDTGGALKKCRKTKRGEKGETLKREIKGLESRTRDLRGRSNPTRAKEGGMLVSWPLKRRAESQPMIEKKAS